MFFFYSRLISGYCIDKFRVNKVWFWSVAHILCATTAIIVASNKTIFAVMTLAALLGNNYENKTYFLNKPLLVVKYPKIFIFCMQFLRT